MTAEPRSPLGAGWDAWRQAWRGWPASPIFRRELRYWDRRLGGHWRINDGLAGLALFNLCLLPAALLVYPPLLLGYGLLDEVLGWLIAYPAALGIVRERENQTWTVLRATPLSAFEILAGKLAALNELAGDGVGLLMRARSWGLLAALPLFGLMLWAGRRANPFSAGWPAWAGLALLAAAYSLFVCRPWINLISGAGLGLACSTLDRRVSASLTAVTLAGSLFSLGGAALIIIFWHAPVLEGLFSASILTSRLAPIGVWLFSGALLTLGRALLTPVCLAVAAWRLPQLEE